MFANNRKWSDSDIERVRGLLKIGLGYSAIAKEFGPNYTRNMIAGVHHRFLKTLECKSILRCQTDMPKKIKRNPAVKKPTPNPMNVKPAYIAKPTAECLDPISLHDAGPCDCRFPIGEPRELKICGAPTNGSIYCAPHMSDAYTVKQSS